MRELRFGPHNLEAHSLEASLATAWPSWLEHREARTLKLAQKEGEGFEGAPIKGLVAEDELAMGARGWYGRL